MIYEKLFYFHCETGTCGCEDSQVLSHDDNTFDLDETAHELAQQNAESHGEDGFYYCSNCCNQSDNADECNYCGSEDVDWEESQDYHGSWELYKPEEHNMKVCGGANSIFDRYPLAFEHMGAWYNPVGESGIEKQMIAWQASEMREMRVRDRQWESTTRDLERKINTIRGLVC